MHLDNSLAILVQLYLQWSTVVSELLKNYYVEGVRGSFTSEWEEITPGLRGLAPRSHGLVSGPDRSAISADLDLGHS